MWLLIKINEDNDSMVLNYSDIMLMNFLNVGSDDKVKKYLNGIWIGTQAYHYASYNNNHCGKQRFVLHSGEYHFHNPNTFQSAGSEQQPNMKNMSW